MVSEQVNLICYTVPFADASIREQPTVQDGEHPAEAQPDQEECVYDDDTCRLLTLAWMCFR